MFSENTAEIHLGGRILLDRTEDEWFYRLPTELHSRFLPDRRITSE